MKKKVILGIVIIALVIAVSVLTTLLVVKNISKDGKSSKSADKEKYEDFAEEFAVALKSEENMEEFLDKNMDYKGMYAYNSEELYDAKTAEEYNELFEEIRKDVSSEDLEEMKDMYIGGFKGLVEYGLDLKLKETKENKDKDYPDFKSIEAIYEQDGEIFTFFFSLYKEKLIMITRGEGLEYLYEDTAYYSGDEDVKVNLTTAEKISINKRIREILDRRDYKNGADIRDLIDTLIKINEEFLDKKEFVGLYVSLEGVNNNDLIKAMDKVREDRSEDNIRALNKEMEKLKAALDKNETYYITISTNHGVIMELSVSDEEY